MKLGSLFDGSGTCPFAASIYGVETAWASEIEPFPIKITSKQFPNMKHLGDICQVSGAEIEPVDIVTFGSPCQNLSVAGNRAGLAGQQSSLFMEAIRIINEMRKKTNGRYPQIAIWENVPGAFSSNNGNDFRTVLEELCKIKESGTVIPRPARNNGRWPDAGLILGNGFSIAWRVFDAQFWGVPQRRRRIYLVADFGGHGAGKILFEREGLSRNFAESRESWKGLATDSFLCTDTTGECYDARGNGNGKIAPTITGDHNNRITDYTAVFAFTKNLNANADTSACDKKTTNIKNCADGLNKGQYIVFNSLQDPVYSDKHTPCLSTGNPKYGQSNLSVVCYSIDKAAFNQGINAQYRLGIADDGISPTLISERPHAVALITQTPSAKLAVRRVTPKECARLQGMPDWWCDGIPHSDSQEYKMWGNGMALPCVMFVMENTIRILKERT